MVLEKRAGLTPRPLNPGVVPPPRGEPSPRAGCARLGQVTRNQGPSMKRRSRKRQPHGRKTDARYYDGQWLNKRLRSMHISILVFLKQHNWRHATRQKAVSPDYGHKRYLVLGNSFLKVLPRRGYEPTALLKLKRKHFVVVVRDWEAQGLTGGTMQARYSVFAWVCARLRKTDCLPQDPASVLDDPARWRVDTVARREKTPSSMGIDTATLFAEIAREHPVVALQLRAQEEFGLRTKEAVRLHPHEADRGDYLLITSGSKGGRPRTIPFCDFQADFDLDVGEVVAWDVRENAGKRALIEQMKQAAVPGRSLIPRRYTLAQWRREVCAVAEAFGLTGTDKGATPHGLRHEYLCRRAETISGLTRALRRTGALAGRDLIRDRVARQIVAIDAGHHDTYTTEVYYGPRTEKAPQGLIGRIARCLRGSVREPLIRRVASGRFVGGKGRRIRVLDGPPAWLR